MRMLRSILTTMEKSNVQSLILSWILLLRCGTITLGETLGRPSITSAVNSTNSTLCEDCPSCEPCRSCVIPIILAFVITSIVTALLLAIIYVPILIVVSDGYSKIVPHGSQMGKTQQKPLHELEGSPIQKIGRGNDGEGVGVEEGIGFSERDDGGGGETMRVDDEEGNVG